MEDVQNISQQKHHLVAGLLTVVIVFLLICLFIGMRVLNPGPTHIVFKSVDTMKYSRDLSREKLNDKNFDQIIEKQLEEISSTGATHVAIATPYDDEFLPILKRWVNEARKNNLKVWFRGNFSGWEGWFGYNKITRAQHLRKTESFILKNRDIFEDGDAFTGCPECENGGPGDPRNNNDVVGHRQFLIDQYNLTSKTFKILGKDITTNYESMNYDVAKLVMDKNTTKAIGGVVTIDHYVKSPEQLDYDINMIAKLTGGKVVLGEYGVPIPDIHGNLGELEQMEWLDRLFGLLSKNKNLIGLSYWVNTGGSTQLWNEKGARKAGVEALTKFYKEN